MNNVAWFSQLTHSLINHFESVPNSKKQQMTTEMWLLKDFNPFPQNKILDQTKLKEFADDI